MKYFSLNLLVLLMVFIGILYFIFAIKGFMAKLFIMFIYQLKNNKIIFLQYFL